MKKIISLLISASIAASAMSSLAVSSAGTDTDKDIALFGDSIAAGYGLSSSEHNYGEICADYLGGTAANYAVSGATSTDMLNKIKSLSDSDKKTVKNSEYIVISVGANDLLHYASKRLLTFGSKKKLLQDGVSASDIPADPTISDLLRYLDIEKVKAYAGGGTANMIELGAELKKLCANLRYDDEGYVGTIPNIIIPNIKNSVSAIKAINPNAKIIVQTVYNPFQLTTAFFGSASVDSSTADMITSNFKGVIDELSAQIKKLDGVQLADIYSDFTALPEGVKPTAENPGSASYFTNIELAGEERDFHPNQRGHLAIAANILYTIGDLHDDNGLLTSTFLSLNNRADYPVNVIDRYKTVAGNILQGDVDFDGKYTAQDASITLRNYVLLSSSEGSILSPIQKKCADSDHDEIAKADDASMILKYYTYVSSNGKLDFESYFASLK